MIKTTPGLGYSEHCRSIVAEGGHVVLEGLDRDAAFKVIDLLKTVNDLQAERKAIQENSRVLTCVYCGHEYPPGTPASNHEALTAHIQVCEKHPMFALKQEAEYWKGRAATYLKALNRTSSSLPCHMADFLGKDLYEECFGPSEEEEESEE